MKLNRLRAAPLLLALTSVVSPMGVGASEANRVYDASCALCHQRAGLGLPGQFPRLAGRAGEISATPEGRSYLIEVTLFGMAGKIEVDDTAILGVMPGFTSLSNEDVVSALNYVIGLDGSVKSKAKRTLVTPADVESVRSGSTLSPAQVRANREKAVAMHKK